MDLEDKTADISDDVEEVEDLSSPQIKLEGKASFRYVCIIFYSCENIFNSHKDLHQSSWNLAVSWDVCKTIIPVPFDISRNFQHNLQKCRLLLTPRYLSNSDYLDVCRTTCWVSHMREEMLTLLDHLISPLQFGVHVVISCFCQCCFMWI